MPDLQPRALQPHPAPPAQPAAPAQPAGEAGPALAVLAAMLEAPGARAAAQVLAAELGARLGCTHLRIGRVEGGDSRAWVAWDAPGAPAGPTGPAAEAALDEALDQGLALAWPAAEAHGEAGATPPGITLALAGLARGLGPDGAALSLPLVDQAQPQAVLLLLRRGPLRDGERRLAAHLCALAAPVLALQLARERSPGQALRLRLRAAWQRLRAPRSRGRRRVLAAAGLAWLLLATVPVEQRVAGRARIEGAEQRVLAAPVDGFLKAAHVHPGDRVRAGQLLADLAEQDLQLERDKWTSQLAQHENAYAAAMARSDRGEAAVALAKAAEAEAQLALVREQLQRAQLTAPFDGIVIDGDLSQRIGAPVRQGDALITVADGRAFRVVVQVDERDAGAVRAGQRGVLALSALPWDTLDIRVLRVTPLAKVEEGANVFEVQAELLAAPPRLAEVRPGLQGQAKLVVGRAPWLWGTLQPLARRVRVAVWGWTG